MSYVISKSRIVSLKFMTIGGAAYRCVIPNTVAYESYSGSKGTDGTHRLGCATWGPVFLWTLRGECPFPHLETLVMLAEWAHGLEISLPGAQV